MRLSKIEILDRFRMCCQKLGKTPGKALFCKTAKVSQADIDYYWARPSDLAKEAGAVSQGWNVKIPDSELFEEYAKVCLHLGKIPTVPELRIATRELRTRTNAIRRGPIGEFDSRFRIWLDQQSDDNLRQILNFSGWNRKIFITEQAIISPSDNRNGYSFHPFLPACLQYLDVLGRGELPQNEDQNQSVPVLFERRCADAFRCLGFEVEDLGQGKGRATDFLALARREQFALIVDAKVRREGYVLGTEDRKFLEYAINHGRELQSQGFDKIYLIIVSVSFREKDLTQLTAYLTKSPIRSVDLISVSALMRIVEDSIRRRHSFGLNEIDKLFFGNKIISN